MRRFMGRAQDNAASAAPPADGDAPAGDRPVGNGSGPSRRGNRTVVTAAVLSAVAALGFALYAGYGAHAARNGTKAADGLTPAQRAASGAAVSSQPAASPAAASGQGSRVVTAADAFRQIVLPDVLIVAPQGLSARQVASLHKIAGVRDMITFDGAGITVGGQSVNVIGVNPVTFRSWVPLRTASDQPFWTALGRGDFVASSGAATALHLQQGASYDFVGSSSQVLSYGMSAALGLTGIDVLVNQAASARLGLVRQVAGLISAPGVGLTTLMSKVSRILGPSGRIESLRAQLPVASVPAGTVPTNYIDLFKASAAQYCPGLSWTVLAAIGQIESADGTNMGPSSAGALGPMQFLPSTWAQWGIDAFGQAGPPDVMNPYDAVPAAARLLCADGAAAGGTSLYHAIFDYNHADWYVREVLALAAKYAANYS
jgi:Transglycosylase SLT domain